MLFLSVGLSYKAGIQAVPGPADHPAVIENAEPGTSAWGPVQTEIDADPIDFDRPYARDDNRLPVQESAGSSVVGSDEP